MNKNFLSYDKIIEKLSNQNKDLHNILNKNKNIINKYHKKKKEFFKIKKNIYKKNIIKIRPFDQRIL